MVNGHERIYGENGIMPEIPNISYDLGNELSANNSVLGISNTRAFRNLLAHKVGDSVYKKLDEFYGSYITLVNNILEYQTLSAKVESGKNLIMARNAEIALIQQDIQTFSNMLDAARKSDDIDLLDKVIKTAQKLNEKSTQIQKIVEEKKKLEEDLQLGDKERRLEDLKGIIQYNFKQFMIERKKLREENLDGLEQIAIMDEAQKEELIQDFVDSTLLPDRNGKNKEEAEFRALGATYCAMAKIEAANYLATISRANSLVKHITNEKLKSNLPDGLVKEKEQAQGMYLISSEIFHDGDALMRTENFNVNYTRIVSPLISEEYSGVSELVNDPKNKFIQKENLFNSINPNYTMLFAGLNLVESSDLGLNTVTNETGVSV